MNERSPAASAPGEGHATPEPPIDLVVIDLPPEVPPPVEAANVVPPEGFRTVWRVELDPDPDPQRTLALDDLAAADNRLRLAAGGAPTVLLVFYGLAIAALEYIGADRAGVAIGALVVALWVGVALVAYTGHRSAQRRVKRLGPDTPAWAEFHRRYQVACQTVRVADEADARVYARPRA